MKVTLKTSKMPKKPKTKKPAVQTTIDLLEEPAPKPLLQYQKLYPEAFCPTRATSDSIGYDLRTPFDYVLPSRQTLNIPIGLVFKIPFKHYGRIAPKSGLAVKFSIDVLAGVIDSDYRGELVVVLINHGSVDVQLYSGQMIAQLILERATIADLKEEKKLDKTQRGDRGLGKPKTPETYRD